MESISFKPTHVPPGCVSPKQHMRNEMSSVVWPLLWVITHVADTHLSSGKEHVREKLQGEEEWQMLSSVLGSYWERNIEKEDRAVSLLFLTADKMYCNESKNQCSKDSFLGSKNLDLKGTVGWWGRTEYVSMVYPQIWCLIQKKGELQDSAWKRRSP